MLVFSGILAAIDLGSNLIVNSFSMLKAYGISEEAVISFSINSENFFLVLSSIPAPMLHTTENRQIFPSTSSKSLANLTSLPSSYA